MTRGRGAANVAVVLVSATAWMDPSRLSHSRRTVAGVSRTARTYKAPATGRPGTTGTAGEVHVVASLDGNTEVAAHPSASSTAPATPPDPPTSHPAAPDTAPGGRMLPTTASSVSIRNGTRKLASSTRVPMSWGSATLMVADQVRNAGRSG